MLQGIKALALVLVGIIGGGIAVKAMLENPESDLIVTVWSGDPYKSKVIARSRVKTSGGKAWANDAFTVNRVRPAQVRR